MIVTALTPAGSRLKLTVVAPSGTVSVGRLIPDALDVSCTVTPFGPAGADSVTVPTVVSSPPKTEPSVTVEGLKEKLVTSNG